MGRKGAVCGCLLRFLTAVAVLERFTVGLLLADDWAGLRALGGKGLDAACIPALFASADAIQNPYPAYLVLMHMQMHSLLRPKSKVPVFPQVRCISPTRP
jgi:hypothetical protein